MKSGIYKLTFDNGSIYIGKSLDMERRWEEHSNSFRKGTAAKKMQNAYILAGFPNAEVLLECHPDHLDLMESAFMYAHTPDLNTTQPIRLTPEEITTLFDNTDILVQSTSDHIDEINNLYDIIDKLKDARDAAEEEVEDLSIARTEQELKIEMGRKYHALKGEYDVLLHNYKTVNTEVKKIKDEYKNKSWWKRLLNK
jgi:GIY-YIG catalytic domain